MIESSFLGKAGKADIIDFDIVPPIVLQIVAVITPVDPDDTPDAQLVPYLHEILNDTT